MQDVHMKLYPVPYGKSRIQQEEALFNSKLDLNLRMKLVQCYIRSTAVHGAENWKLRKEDHKHLTSFEMWCWRRMEKRNEVQRRAK